MVLDSLQSDEVWIAGEALIDEVSVNNGIAQPFVGGGPANTARALGKLGLNSFLVTGISTDLYGSKIVKELTEDGVNLSFALLSDLATATAKVSIDNSGAANYEFLLEGTSTFDFKFSRLPTGTPSVLHVGSLGTLIEPGASHLFEWAKSIFSPKVYDPNVRPSVLSDRKKYSASVEKWIGICDVLKMSEEDFFWLFDGEIEPADLLELGPSLLVITKGEGGLIGFHDSGFVAVPSVSVKVVDTVGAGDTVGAILVDEIYRNGVKGVLENLENVLIRAAKAAAITCSRAGANPPSREELEAF
jgi:fructokinase